jgi:hypothetical protein
MATKSLRGRQREAARRALDRVLVERFAGDQTKMAEAIGISQPFLSEVLSGKKGAGGKTLMGLYAIEPSVAAEIGGRTAEPMLALPPAPAERSAPLTYDAEGETISSVDQDAIEGARGRAVRELIKDGFDPKGASDAIDAVAIDHASRPIDWRDYYFAAKGAVRRDVQVSVERSAKPRELLVKLDAPGGIEAEIARLRKEAAAVATEQEGDDRSEDPGSKNRVKRTSEPH